jgi:hypothetical protein
VIEKWQTAVIFNQQSGTPTAFGNSACGTFNNQSTTDVALGPLPTGSVHTVGNNVEYSLA